MSYRITSGRKHLLPGLLDRLLATATVGHCICVASLRAPAGNSRGRIALHILSRGLSALPKSPHLGKAMVLSWWLSDLLSREPVLSATQVVELWGCW